MPLKPLSKIPLTFLLDRNVELGKSPYDVLPWTNRPFRRLCGLKPLKGDDTDDTDNVEESDGQFVDISEGFILTEEAMQSMSEKNQQFFTSESREKITHFLTEVRKHGEQLRSTEAKLKKKKRRGGKKTSMAVGDDTSGEETFVDRVENISGFEEFRGASLAMQNRAGGAIVEAIKIMKDMDRTPMTAWKNFRQQDIDAKKAELHFHNPPGIGRYLDDRLITRVANVLFGAAAFMESSDILWGCYDKVTRSTIRRAWEREMRGARKTLKKGKKTKEAYEDALKAARETPCPRLLHKVSKSLKAWKDLAEITGEATESSFATSSRDLEDLWSDLGFSSDLAQLGDNVKGRRTGRKLLRALATPEQMEAAYASYREQHFSEMDDAMGQMTEALRNIQESAPSDSDPDTIAVDLLQGTGSSDLGVDEFAQAPTAELLRLLGLIKTGTLPLASEHLKGRRHQYLAEVIMLKRMFTLSLGDAPMPTLLCDDVGLGKTAQIIGVISMLVHCYELQQAGKPLPPFVVESGTPYFAGLEKIPQLPSIILMPLGLIAQWYQQIKHFTIDGAFQVIEYSTTQFNPIVFFEPGGTWDKHCTGKDCHRTIILVPISVVASEAKQHIGELDKGAAGRNRAFRGETKKLGSDLATILNKQFLFFACDEIHNLRNLGWAQLGGQQISANSLVRIGATATPIFHGSRDVLAIGRILRVETMIGNAGYELGMNMLKSEQTRRRQCKREEEDTQGSASQDASNPEDDFLARRLATINASKHRTFFIHREAIDMAKVELIPIIIRRTGESKDPDGNKILDVECYYESIAWSPQREHEMEMVQKLMEALLNCKSDGDTRELQIIWKNFLLDHKKVLFHWRLKGWKPDDPAFWMTWTAKSLQEDALSKILMTISLTQHYQQPDAKPLFFNEDGTRDFAKETECGCKPANQPRKVIVFVMYTIHRKIMKRSLSLVGLQSAEYDGRMTPETRDETLKQFESDDNIRVLLMSNVGTTGLNLTMASVIIFLSGLWSGMEIKQTIGRVWRPGQTLPVIIHHIFAPGTADVVLAALAGDKVLMLDHFYEAKTIADKIFNTHEDQDESDTEWQGEDVPSGNSRQAVKSKAPTRPRKTTRQGDPKSKSMNKPETQSEPLKGQDQGRSDTPGNVGSSKVLARPRKRPLPEAAEDKNKKNNHEQEREPQPEPKNSSGRQSRSTGDKRPIKKAKTSSQKAKASSPTTNSLAMHIQPRSLPTDHALSLPTDQALSLPTDQALSLPNDQALSLPTDHALSLPSGTRSPSPIQPAPWTESSSLAGPPSPPLPRISSPVPLSHGSSPMHTQPHQDNSTT
ncbi:hypothetical protein FRC11_005391, partial [Ceratobasidium sp. 423]